MEKAELIRSTQTWVLTHVQSVAICEGKYQRICYIYRLSRSRFSVCLMCFIVWKNRATQMAWWCFENSSQGSQRSGQDRGSRSVELGGSVKPDFLVERVQQCWAAAMCKMQTLMKRVYVCVSGTFFHVILCVNLQQMSKYQFLTQTCTASTAVKCNIHINAALICLQRHHT